jgi:hypothetical protein
MLRRLLFALLVFAVWPISRAQPQNNTYITPDCRINFTLTNGQSSASFDNRSQGCATWAVFYTVEGTLNPVSLTFQTAPDNGSGAPGTFVTWAGTVVTGTNPLTDTSGTMATFGPNFYPWLNVTLAATGGGTVKGAFYGWKQQGARVGGGGGGTGNVSTLGLTTNVLPVATAATVLGDSRISQTPLSGTAPIIGPEILTNGNFSAGLTGWTVTPALSWIISGGYATGAANGAVLSQATGGSGNVIVTFTAVTAGAGGPLTVTDDNVLNTDFSQAGTYVVYAAAGNIYFTDNSTAGGWQLSVVSAKSYSVPYTTPVPSFVSMNDGQNPEPLEFRYGFDVLGIGYQAAGSNSTNPSTNGTGVTAVGHYAAQNNTQGFVTALGDFAAQNNTLSYVTAVGYESASNNVGQGVAAIGFQSAFNNTGYNVTAIGTKVAMYNTGGSLTATGYKSASNNAGDFVTSTGFLAAQSNTGNNVVAIGYSTALTNTGDGLVAEGYQAAQDKLGGDGTVIIGYETTSHLPGTQKNIDTSVIIGPDSTTGANNSGATQLTNIVAVNGTATASNTTVIGNPGTVASTIFGTQAVPSVIWNSNVEGGCGAYTDAVINGTDPTLITSASYTFVSADTGGIVQVTAGTGFTTGSYRIVNVSGGGAAYLDRPVGTVTSTGGSFSVNRGRSVWVQGATDDTFHVCGLRSSVYAWRTPDQY